MIRSSIGEEHTVVCGSDKEWGNGSSQYPTALRARCRGSVQNVVGQLSNIEL